MPWVRVDDAFYDHSKWIEAGPLAGWLGMCALAWCNRNLTDGFIPHGKVQLLADFSMVAEISETEDPTEQHVEAWRTTPYELAARLVDLGLWERAAGGFLVHDYLRYQKSAAQIKDIAMKRAESGRKGGLSKPEATDEQDASKPEAKVEPQPQPQDSSNDESGGGKRRTKPREDFEPTEAHTKFAAEQGLSLFNERDRWVTNCEAKGVKYERLNAGFSTWLHQAVDFGRGGKPVATLEELTTPRLRQPFECAVGNPECTDGWIDTERGAVECECRRTKAVTG